MYSRFLNTTWTAQDTNGEFQQGERSPEKNKEKEMAYLGYTETGHERKGGRTMGFKRKITRFRVIFDVFIHQLSGVRGVVKSVECSRSVPAEWS